MLDELITREILKKLGDAAAFIRGEEYFSAGAVDRLRATGDKITASLLLTFMRSYAATALVVKGRVP